MKREFEPIYAESPDESSQIIGAGIGASYGPNLVLGLSDLLSLLNRVGGQAYITAVRRKFDPEGNIVPADPQIEKATDGEWATVGYLIQYENRDTRLGVSKFPDLDEQIEAIEEPGIDVMPEESIVDEPAPEVAGPESAAEPVEATA
jgi:hypothetical protein